MKGNTLRKHNLHEKTAALVLLKLFSGNLNNVHISVFCSDNAYLSLMSKLSSTVKGWAFLCGSVMSFEDVTHSI